MIAILAGTVLLKAKSADIGKRERVKTPYGEAVLYVEEDVVFVQRHTGGVPPHMINHRANIHAIKRYTDQIVGVGSVGSLKREFGVGAIAIPTDYIDLNPQTFYDNEIKHITPGFDEDLRQMILEGAKKAKIDVIDDGVYMQTRGPRLETKAEVRMFKQFADIVGMTIASEATLAKELGIGYAAICSVDNFAHGIAGYNLDFEDIKNRASQNREKIETILGKIVEDRK
jgi:5'-methylthioadenosine phosphorylase